MSNVIKIVHDTKTLMHESMKVQKRIEKEIDKTPTGELRNLLCDTNICIEAFREMIAGILDPQSV